MDYAARAEKVKVENIVDMAITFTAMLRVLKGGSKEKLTAKFLSVLPVLEKVRAAEDYNAIHTEFCLWFTANIQTPSRKLKNGSINKSHASSWGHAAKVYDLVMKVCVYYCRLPTPEVATRIVPFMKGAVDTPILKHLKETFIDKSIKAKTIEQIDREAYELLQGLIDTESQGKAILPVQYDDLMWRDLNRSQAGHGS